MRNGAGRSGDRCWSRVQRRRPVCRACRWLCPPLDRGRGAKVSLFFPHCDVSVLVGRVPMGDAVRHSYEWYQCRAYSKTGTLLIKGFIEWPSHEWLGRYKMFLYRPFNRLAGFWAFLLQMRCLARSLMHRGCTRSTQSLRRETDGNRVPDLLQSVGTSAHVSSSGRQPRQKHKHASVQRQPEPRSDERQSKHTDAAPFQP